MRHVSAVIFAAILALIGATPARATEVKELVRIKGQGESVLRGIGLVVGLSGTGDSGKELVMARPLAKVLENEGNAVGDLKELAASKSVAVVLIQCIIPESGGRTDDRFDITISTVNSASSLKGGTLYLAPLSGPFPGSPVYAMAAGTVDLQDPSVPTTARVRGGARLVQDIMMPQVGTGFELIIEPHFAGWGAASEIASSIDRQYFNNPSAAGPSIAKAIDERTIRILIPENERADKAAFIADVLATDINMSMLKLPAQVICNSRTGVIIVTGDVEIAPAIITTDKLNITTTVPPPTPTAANPLVQRDKWTSLQTNARPQDMSKLTDLLAAFKSLQVSSAEQIEVLQTLHKTGKLHAKLVID